MKAIHSSLGPAPPAEDQLITRRADHVIPHPGAAVDGAANCLCRRRACLLAELRGWDTLIEEGIT